MFLILLIVTIVIISIMIIIITDVVVVVVVVWLWLWFVFDSRTLTALVLSSHTRDEKKYVVTPRRVAYQLKEEKRSRFDQSTLRKRTLSMGPHLVFLYEKIIRGNGRKVSEF